MFEGVHRRYVYLEKSLDSQTLTIRYYNPVRQFWVDQVLVLAMSAGHVQHHLAHSKLALAS